MEDKDLIDIIEESHSNSMELSTAVKGRIDSEVVFTDGVTSKVPLSLVERAVCELRADKKTNLEVALFLGISSNDVKNIINRKHVKEFLQQLINAQYDVTKEYKLELLSKVIDAKLKALEDEDGKIDFANSTRKDIVDLLLIQDSLLKEREKKELGTSEDTYITLLQQIIK